MISKIEIKNFKSIINTTLEINDNIFVLAGQNEAYITITDLMMLLVKWHL